ncbi:MAG: homoserine O-acetyltransferase [Gemmatimonadota bacterium]
MSASPKFARAARAHPSHPSHATHAPRAALRHAGWAIEDTTIVLHDVQLEGGALLDRVRVHYRLEGTIAPARDNVVLVVHALTGTAHASAWWPGVIGAGAAIDPARHAVLCANLLGGCDGTTGPREDAPDALPRFTTRDQAHVLARLLDALDIERPLLVCGGSLGGMVTLEFAASFPDRVRSAVSLAAPAAQTAQGLAWNAIMRRAIEIGGAREGLALARMVGMLSYRTAEGLERRFGRSRGETGQPNVTEWLSAHGEKLVSRFDAASYLALLDAMDTHDVGRARGGVTAALSPVADRLTGVGLAGDLLYPADAVREWASAAQADYEDVQSVHGHDAFLLETARVSAIVRQAIEAARR